MTKGILPESDDPKISRQEAITRARNILDRAEAARAEAIAIEAAQESEGLPTFGYKVTLRNDMDICILVAPQLQDTEIVYHCTSMLFGDLDGETTILNSYMDVGTWFEATLQKWIKTVSNG